MEARQATRHHRAVRAGAVLASPVLLLSGCAGTDSAAAIWRVGPGQHVGPSTTSFTAMVSRLGCNNGVTGEVRAPEVRVEDDEVVVTFTVEPIKGDASCPGNDEVAYEIELPEPLGGRNLVDGQCESDEARSTQFCEPDGVRYGPS